MFLREIINLALRGRVWTLCRSAARQIACENIHLMRSRLVSFALLASLTMIGPLFGHDTWLAPDRSHAETPGIVVLSLSSGMEFPMLDHAIAGDRVASAKWRSAQGSGELPSGTRAPNALEWRVNAFEGVTLFSVALHPRPSRLKRDQVRAYVDHLGLPNAAAVFSRWKRTSKADEIGYRYMKYAKTFVGRGSGEASPLWGEAADLRLELIPQSNPTSLTAGSTLEVQLVDRGKPLARYPVALLVEGTKDPMRVVTGVDGRARFVLPASGHYMMRATTLEPSADKASVWDVHFTTMTFEVARRR